jgi:hypothetical protein
MVEEEKYWREKACDSRHNNSNNRRYRKQPYWALHTYFGTY